MDEQTHRQRWFAFVEGRQPDSLPFFPDISDWYKARHQLPNEPQAYFTVALIPDGSGLNRRQMDMPLE